MKHNFNSNSVKMLHLLSSSSIVIVVGLSSTVIFNPGKLVGGIVIVNCSVGSVTLSSTIGTLKHDLFWLGMNLSRRADEPGMV